MYRHARRKLEFTDALAKREAHHREGFDPYPSIANLAAIREAVAQKPSTLTDVLFADLAFVGLATPGAVVETVKKELQDILADVARTGRQATGNNSPR